MFHLLYYQTYYHHNNYNILKNNYKVFYKYVILIIGDTMNKEEERNVISMDMGGAIEPVELPTEEAQEEIEESRSTVVPELMQINTSSEVPSILDDPTIKDIPAPVEVPAPVITEVPKPVEVPTPMITEAPKPVEVPTPVITEAPKPVEVPTPVITEVPKPVEVPKPAEVPAPVVEETQTPEVSTPSTTFSPTVAEVKENLMNIINSKAVKKEPEVKVETPVTPTPTPVVLPVTVPTIPVENKVVSEPVVNTTEVIEDKKEKEEQIKNINNKQEENIKIEEEAIKQLGPNVITEPLAKEDKEKEKKKNPHFFECPPDCIPIRPMGYILLTIIYNIPIIGLIVILVHSASYKNLNRRNFARSYLIAIILIALIIFALIYFLKVDFIGIIENITGYKIDLQHFKFIKFK